MSVCSIFELFSIKLTNTHLLSELLSVVASPEAVLHDEDEEKQEATTHGGDTETKERTSNVVLEAVDAAIGGAAGGWVLGPVERGDLADTCAVIGILKPIHPVHQTLVVGLLPEALGKGFELVSLTDGISCIGNAVFVGGNIDGWVGDEVSSDGAWCVEAPVNDLVVGSSIRLAGAFVGAHPLVNSNRLVDVEAVGDLLILTTIWRGASVCVVIGESFASFDESILGKSSSSNGNTSNDDHSEPGGQEDKAVEECEASVLDAFEAEAEATDEQSRQSEDQKHNEYSILGILDFNILLTNLIQNVGICEYEWEGDHDDWCNDSKNRQA